MSRDGLSTGRRWGVGGLRALVAGLVVLALSDLRVPWRTDALAVAAILDDAPSITPAEREALRGALAAEPPADATLRVLEPSSAPVETALGVAVATLPRERIRRVLLATDGRSPTHDLEVAVAQAHASGVEVDVLPLGEATPADAVAVTGLQVPRLVRPGETLDLAVHLLASRAGDVRIAAQIDEGPPTERTVSLAPGPGSVAFTMTFPGSPGVHTVDVRAHAAQDRRSENDRWTALFEVLPRPSVLLLHRADVPEPALAPVLRDAGLDVTLARAPQAPATLDGLDGFSLVLADEIELGDLSEPQQQSLRAWVEERGGGLVTITGSHPVRRTPAALRALEPIEPPPAQPEPRPIELVLVIDRSSSMSGPLIVQARRAGVAAIRALRPDARIGAVAFSGSADAVQPPVPMENALVVEQFVRRLFPSGGTNIAAAIQAANRVMSSDPRYLHHVILVSDGESEPQAATAAAIALAGRGVSISAITIGPYSALLAEIARIGRGRYHVTSASGLTSLMVDEAAYRQPPAARAGSFVPREQTHLAMLDGVSFEGTPPFTGHALAAARPGATVAFTATEGMPLLAHWHRGTGQVASFASATSGAWADGFRTSPAFRTLWTSLARGMLRRRTVEPPRVDLEPHPVDAALRILTVTSPLAEDMPAPLVRVSRGGAMEAWPLRARGPGVFQAELPASSTLLVDARMPSDPAPTAADGDETPYPERLRAFGPDRDALARLAALGGGRLLATPAEVFAPGPPAVVPWPLRTALLASALLVYLLSLLVLRLPGQSAPGPAPEASRGPQIP